MKPKTGRLVFLRYNKSPLFRSSDSFYVMEIRKCDEYIENKRCFRGEVIYSNHYPNSVGETNNLYYEYDYFNIYRKGTPIEDILMVERI